ncbi:unnamed protein product [Paramecium octaurelia]|uniref:Uncharacterized protein n=1 Tax=Paramecium octaurelia TaxID=43137 RepID=A0A8S1YLY6_PAROT|nr:unnamed protein product [Paramecium octaurelia]
MMANKIFRIKQTEVKSGQIIEYITSSKILEYIQEQNQYKPGSLYYHHPPDKIGLLMICQSSTKSIFSFKSKTRQLINYFTFRIKDDPRIQYTFWKLKIRKIFK